MIAKLTLALREAPSTVPALAALAVFVVWATSQAGYPVTHWAPGALVVLVLLLITLVLVRPRATEVPRTTAIAIAALAAYTALSFASMLWANVPADAWDGANRTLLYLLVFTLFALWPQRGLSASLLLVVWALALTALAAFALLHVDAAKGPELATLLPGGRLTYPSGYANANAAQWLLAFWPALLLACSTRTQWALRGLLAGSAVLLGEVALLSQSRGAAYATPVMLVLVLALLPGRVRKLSVMIPVAGGIAAAAPSVLRVGNHLSAGRAVPSHVHAATLATAIAALVTAVLVGAGALLQARRPLAPPTARRVHRLAGAGAVAVLALALVAVVAFGRPVHRVEHAWQTFKSGRGYGANGSGSRLTSGFGSQRYDFYRVGLDEFLAHPLVGIGADNFQQQYLVHGHSTEEPRYPHSIEIRTLAETGLAGSALALLGLLAALAGALRAAASRLARRADPLAAEAAAAALAGFAYWLVHGSFDWFFEFAGLGAPAFAMLGLACALAPLPAGAGARDADTSPPAAASALMPARRAVAAPGARRALRRAAIAAAVGVALAAGASLTLPWIAGLLIDHAARVWPRSPATAYAELHEAADLNPFSDEPYVLAGSIALRFGDLRRAEREFAAALKRVPGDGYALLQLGTIASTRRQRARALREVGRASALQPRDALTAEVLLALRRGDRVSVAEVDRALFRKGAELR
jgi:tetratricopeptide (TPR) repeat protein